jgi:NAD(P)-dependent dehydrogenase (short-subunit alcohol dehydrogenase family)
VSAGPARAGTAHAAADNNTALAANRVRVRGPQDGGMDFTGKRVLVTGAASGIGLACARAFLSAGAQVGIVDRDQPPVSSELSSDSVVAVRADVTDEPRLASAICTVARQFGGLAVVVGVSGPVGVPLGRISAEDVAAVLAVNVTGQFLLVKHALSWLGPDGSVVLLGSDSGYVAAPGMVPYCASKGAVIALTRALAVELPGIRVNCVCPSVVDTPMARADLGNSLDSLEFPVQDPADVAGQVLFLASPAARTINGHALLADYGMSARSGFPA